MLPPVLEVYVIWHPDDVAGAEIAREIVEHFHGTAYTGLIGGAVEVFVRSAGWLGDRLAPRQIPLPGIDQPNGVEEAQFIAVVPILGNGLAQAVESDTGGWQGYAAAIAASQKTHPQRVGVFPFSLHAQASNGTKLSGIFGSYQRIGGQTSDDDPARFQRCRDLAQSITQFLSGEQQLTAFISHTKHGEHPEAANVPGLIALVRSVISTTHLKQFFDASDLQPGTDWAEVLKSKASSSALLALRTDLYPTREWCQKEVLLAKRHGLPVIMVDAMGFREERGSFLMDHVPRVPIRATGAEWSRRDVYRSLDLLVDECLKRALWTRQQELAKGRLVFDVAWWAPHAPEPVTLAHWLSTVADLHKLRETEDRVRILHPDPALGPDERDVLEQILSLGGLPNKMDVMTPRQLAARGG